MINMMYIQYRLLSLLLKYVNHSNDHFGILLLRFFISPTKSLHGQELKKRRRKVNSLHRQRRVYVEHVIISELKLSRWHMSSLV
jgi:hypothetical protein